MASFDIKLSGEGQTLESPNSEEPSPEEPSLEGDDPFPIPKLRESRRKSRRPLVTNPSAFELGHTSLPVTPRFVTRSSSLPPASFMSSLKEQKRHYKKDSRFVLDLYTITFDEGETVDDVETCKVQTVNNNNNNNEDFVTMPSLTFSSDSGPMSLGSNYSTSTNSQSVRTSLPSLETNLHKILARKIQDSEEISFRKAKLLTKAYYKLLRESATPIVDPQIQVLMHRGNVKEGKRIGEGRLDWQTLLGTDLQELRRIVKGLENTVKALNDYLMELLLERDELLGKQDEMLEEISELTDNLL